MLKKILNLILDDSAIDPITMGALAVGGGALVGGLFGKDEQKTIDPYSGLRSNYQDWMKGKLGTTTPYKYNEDFTTKQPGVESAVESTILGKLKNLPKTESDIKGISDKYYGAQKEQMQERHMEEIEANKNMYNRLGLVSSTPGLKAGTDLGRKQSQEYNVLSADIANQGINREMESLRLAEEIANQYIGQGRVLGQAQRGYEQKAQELSMRDIERMISEEMGYGQQAAGLLSGNPPQYYYEPNIWKQLGGAAQDIGTNLMTAGIKE